MADRMGYKVEVRVSNDCLDEYIAHMDELGFAEVNHMIRDDGKVRASNDYEFLYLLSSDEKDKLLGFCIEQRILSWCKPILIR